MAGYKYQYPYLASLANCRVKELAKGVQWLGYELDERRIGIWFPARVRGFTSSSQRPQRLSGPPSLLSIGHHELFLRGHSGRGVNSAYVTNTWSYTAIPSYFFILCSIKHRDLVFSLKYISIFIFWTVTGVIRQKFTDVSEKRTAFLLRGAPCCLLVDSLALLLWRWKLYVPPKRRPLSLWATWRYCPPLQETQIQFSRYWERSRTSNMRSLTISGVLADILT
jgi:hypothetical protein